MRLPHVEMLLCGMRDTNNEPLNGGKVYSYAAGSSTPKSLYTASDGSSPAANPLTLNSTGQAQVWASGAYKLVIKTAADVTLYTFDNLEFTPNDETLGWGGISSGAANIYNLVTASGFTAYVDGMRFAFRAHQTNSGAAVASVNGLTSYTIYKPDGGGSLTANDIINNGDYILVYENGRFILINPSTPPTIRGNLAMGGFKLTGLGAGSGAGDSVRYEQALLLAGGTMTGDVQFSGASIGARLLQAGTNVAAAGSTQGTATGLTAVNNNITSGSGGVRLPAIASHGIGKPLVLVNSISSFVNVYPASGESIWGYSADAPHRIEFFNRGVGAQVYIPYSSTAWLCLSAADGLSNVDTWTANPTGFSSVTTNLAYYTRRGRLIQGWFRFGGTSNATSFGFTLPSSTNASFPPVKHTIPVTDNSVNLTTPGALVMPTGTSSAVIHKDCNSGTFTSSGVKGAEGAFWYFE